MLKSKIQKIQGSSVRRVLSTPPSLCVSEGGAQVKQNHLSGCVRRITWKRVLDGHLYDQNLKWQNRKSKMLKSKIRKIQGSSVRRVLSTPPSLCLSEGGAQVLALITHFNFTDSIFEMVSKSGRTESKN